MGRLVCTLVQPESVYVTAERANAVTVVTVPMKMKDTGNTFLVLDSALKGMCFYIFYSHFLHLPSWRQLLLNTGASNHEEKTIFSLLIWKMMMG